MIKSNTVTKQDYILGSVLPSVESDEEKFDTDNFDWSMELINDLLKDILELKKAELYVDEEYVDRVLEMKIDLVKKITSAIAMPKSYLNKKEN